MGGYINFGNDILAAYIQGRRLRQSLEEQTFRHKQSEEQLKLQQEREKREEAERQDAMKRFDAQHKLYQERFAFDKEKETLEENQRDFARRISLFNSKNIGRKMIAEGTIPANLNVISPELIHEGLNEFQNTGDVANISRYTSKGPVELFPGLTLQGNEYMTPAESGQAILQQKGPLEDLKTRRQMMLRSQIEAGLSMRAENKSDDQIALERERQKGRINLEGERHEHAKERLRLNSDLITGRADDSARRRAAELGLKHDFDKDLVAFKAQFQKDKGASKGNASRETKLAALKSMREGYQNVFDLGNKSDWRGQNWIRGVPWVNDIDAALTLSDPDVNAYNAALGRITSEEFHKRYGSVLSAGEMKKARTFMAENWNSPEVARTRLKSAIAELDLQIKGLQEASGNAAAIPPPATEAPKRTSHYERLSKQVSEKYGTK